MNSHNQGDRGSTTSSPSIKSAEETKPDEQQPVQKFVGQDLETPRSQASADRNYPELDEDYNFEGSIALSRKASRLTTDYDNLVRQATSSSKPLPPMGNGRPYPKNLGSRDPYVVQFDGENDPGHPKNWRLRTKILYTTTAGLSAFCISIGSALFAEASEDLMRVFHIGWTVATLGTSLFVFGFAAGPVIYGPLSELFGRKMVLIPSSLGYTLFCFAVATAKDVQTVMLCRFFAGFIGAAPLVVAPAVMADMFGARTRGTAITLFAMVLFGGPMLAPILGGFTVKNSSLGWRWTSYFCGIVGALSCVMNVFCLEETHHPIILARRAEELRRRTGNWGIYAPQDEVSLSVAEIAENNVMRPIKMLFTEPILFLITLYNAFIYGMLYLFLTAVPLIFMGKYGWSQGVAELPYISMLLGTLSGGVIVIIFERRYNAAMDRNNGKPIPEERLPPMMIGGVTFTGGMFWLGWSGAFGNKVHWIVPTIGAFFVGNGLMTIFLPCFNYIIDCYLLYAASALAGNTFLRSAFGAAFPLFARQMFVNMKIQWASTLLGCLGAIMIPVPLLFYMYGKRIRSSSKYAFVLE
ncbi:hypothetical protein I9W82_004266 [Candida metapsilosis]|uniref:Major facilitator superfamily (MFS) profile domain-containing protein n=1 Tax=Candida metapsilosis TaxID=273372 RepID=A0A8H8D986_9ASCO|nr:hypothetical protein I9W82_004266 [Candida metapsilosis]